LYWAFFCPGFRQDDNGFRQDDNGFRQDDTICHPDENQDYTTCPPDENQDYNGFRQDDSVCPPDENQDYRLFIPLVCMIYPIFSTTIFSYTYKKLWL
jgi:hypothetical protein